MKNMTSLVVAPHLTAYQTSITKASDLPHFCIFTCPISVSASRFGFLSLLTLPQVVFSLLY